MRKLGYPPSLPHPSRQLTFFIGDNIHVYRSSGQVESFWSEWLQSRQTVTQR